MALLYIYYIQPLSLSLSIYIYIQTSLIGSERCIVFTSGPCNLLVPISVFISLALSSVKNLILAKNGSSSGSLFQPKGPLGLRRQEGLRAGSICFFSTFKQDVPLHSADWPQGWPSCGGPGQWCRPGCLLRLGCRRSSPSPAGHVGDGGLGLVGTLLSPFLRSYEDFSFLSCHTLVASPVGALCVGGVVWRCSCVLGCASLERKGLLSVWFGRMCLSADHFGHLQGCTTHMMRMQGLDESST